MKKFVFIMQHTPTAEQVTRASESGQVVELSDKKLLLVPDDLYLDYAWFVSRAADIVAAVGGICPGDTVQVMGQQQLAMVVNAHARSCGAELVESVTPRTSKEVHQPDGTVKKETVFSFAGFRKLHNY